MFRRSSASTWTMASLISFNLSPQALRLASSWLAAPVMSSRLKLLFPGAFGILATTGFMARAKVKMKSPSSRAGSLIFPYWGVCPVL